MSYMIQIENLLYEATNLYPRLMALRVDLHLPAIIDNGDSVCCFHNNSSGEISRFRNSLKSKIDADQNRKRQRGLRIYDSQAFIIWAKEYSQEGKCHYHICLLFNKDAYYHLGDYEHDNNLRCLIIGAWYSAMGLQSDDHLGLVHFAENGRYFLNKNSSNFNDSRSMLLKRLAYLAKPETKIYGEGSRNYGCGRI
ncbi:inovirus Gp2 family protein [Pantoea sp. B65]|uniref:inovirus Gp2 family protein n=1 Tax=Pantoea sp. B65 TaxID=2813359 RepID=UPI0039B67AD0